MTQIIGVLGATSPVGQVLLGSNWENNPAFIAFSRQNITANKLTQNSVTWQNLHDVNAEELPTIKDWLCLAPIWILPAYFPLLEKCGVKRIVTLSSTSRFTKTQSADSYEQQIVAQLSEGEQQLQKWAEQNEIEWIILRPTLIYGLGLDKNISTIVSFIKRFGFFPLFGAAQGKRQPIRLEDVANACMQALQTRHIRNRAYNITGAETLPYQDMVERIFAALGKKPRLIHFPLSIFRLGIKLLRILPRFKNYTAEMAERMNQDLVFDCSDAKRDFNFVPSPFTLSHKDIK